MSQIFISHSKKDEDIKSFFSSAFGSTNVKQEVMEYEKIMQGEITDKDIRINIQNSAAVFVLLSENVNDIPHTRDWVVWESAVAATLGKEIWVFEPVSDFGKINVALPYFNHYIPIDVNTDEAYAYVRSIIESYDDSQVLPNAVAGGVAGGFLGMIGDTITSAPQKPPSGAVVIGAAFGSVIGAISGSKSHLRPMGISTRCVNCHRLYNVHVRYEFTFRCPGCNQYLELIQPSNLSGRG